VIFPGEDAVLPVRERAKNCNWLFFGEHSGSLERKETYAIIE
jgi:hypothetical protein